MVNPLRAILRIRREELPLALLMFTYFFLVITSFWILKPLKSGLFLEFYDQTGFDLFAAHFNAAEAEQIAKILNMVVAFLAVIVFSWLSHRLRRQQLTYVFSVLYILALLLYIQQINTPGPWVVWSFYLFGDLLGTTLMVTTFFAFLNDSVTAEAAKRMYGLIVLGGVLGGAFGSLAVRVWIARLAVSTWLWICIVMILLVVVTAALAGRIVRRNPPPERLAAPIHEASGNPAFEGARLVFRSRYLLAIVAIVGLYEICSQVLDFQFKQTVSYYLDGSAISTQIALGYAVANWVSMFVQLFLTSLIMTRLGVTVAILVLPVAMAGGSAGFLLLPTLWMGTLLPTLDLGFAYGLNQSAKETLYVPVTREEKYRAKAFIDMFVQRVGKVLAIGFNLAAGALFGTFGTTRWLSLFTILVVVVWILAARFAGRRFEGLAGQEEGPLPASEGRPAPQITG